MTSQRTEEQGLVSIFMLRAVALGLSRAGIDVAGVLTSLGLSPEILLDTEVRLAASTMSLVFDEAVRRTGDGDFALHAVEAVPTGALGFLDYATRSSATMGEALGRVVRFFPLINDGVEAQLDQEGDEARLLLPGRRGPLPRQMAEYQAAMVVARGRLFAGGAWPLRSVRFAHPAPADDREHRRFFDAPVLFGQEVACIAFDRAMLARSFPAADSALVAILERYGEGLVARLPQGDPFLSSARRVVAELIGGDGPRLDAAAARLGVSERTLQRKLATLGTSYQALLDEVRRDMAQGLLVSGGMSIREISFLLGFSEPAVFHRVFRRWTGLTPAEYRRSRKPAAKAGESKPPGG